MIRTGISAGASGGWRGDGEAGRRVGEGKAQVGVRGFAGPNGGRGVGRKVGVAGSRRRLRRRGEGVGSVWGWVGVEGSLTGAYGSAAARSAWQRAGAGGCSGRGGERLGARAWSATPPRPAGAARKRSQQRKRGRGGSPVGRTAVTLREESLSRVMYTPRDGYRRAPARRGSRGGRAGDGEADQRLPAILRHRAGQGRPRPTPAVRLSDPSLTGPRRGHERPPGTEPRHLGTVRGQRTGASRPGRTAWRIGRSVGTARPLPAGRRRRRRWCAETT